jgi:HTH-type transcriptional regulator, competence development regulator
MARTLGDELHKVRQLKGLSLRAVAEPAGVSPTYLHKLERGEVKAPSPHRLQRLAHALGLDYADLFFLAGYDRPEKNPSARGRQSTAPVPLSAKGSLLRQAFQSEEQVSDDELEQLARYLQFLRQQKQKEAADA